ncbi:MAG: hypothetical protein V1708_02760 [Candidatus Micrarchaeota archaeon]
MAGIDGRVLGAIREVKSRAGEIFKEETEAIQELRRKSVYMNPDGSYQIEFARREKDVLRRGPEELDKIYHTERKGKARPPIVRVKPRFAARDDAKRALRHLLDNSSVDSGRLQRLLDELESLNKDVNSGRIGDETARRRTEDALASLKGRKDFVLKLVKQKLTNAEENLADGNVGAACASLVAAVNRVLERMRRKQQIIVPLNQRRLELLAKLEGLEGQRLGLLDEGLGIAHEEIGKTVRIRNSVVSREGGRIELRALVATLAGHSNSLAGRNAASRMRGISLLMEQIRGAPRSVDRPLQLAKQRLFEGELGEGRWHLSQALENALEARRGRLGMRDRDRLAGFIDTLDSLASRLPQQARNAVEMNLRQAGTELTEKHGDPALAHQHLREAKEALERHRIGA